MPTTRDDFLGGRLHIHQPRLGYRAGIDPVLLAAFVHTSSGSVLDVGCGVGVVSLCLAWRLNNLRVTGIDCQSDMITLARQNAEINKMGDRVHFLASDLLVQPSTLTLGSFDAVCTNPPYFDDSSPSSDPVRALARSQQVTISIWVTHCLKMLKPRGYFYMIYPVRGLDEALNALRTAGDITLYPLWTTSGTPSKRLLIRARKGIKSPLNLLPGLVLHDSSAQRFPAGRRPFSPQAEAILRQGSGIFDTISPFSRDQS